MRNVYTVKQVNAYVKNMFAQDFMLSRIYVKGEVSNVKYHTSGHIYFSLKDESGTIACVMFAGQRSGLSFRMREGQQIIAYGQVSIYERDGKYQLYVKEARLDGEGVLYERFLQLKKELEEMGMFAPEYKKPIPKYAKKIGVVTAPTGAAVRDIINVSKRRNPYVDIILFPAQVQGEGAAESIVRGIRMLEAIGVDVMIVGRGGGSIEDLWAFNEEIVARAVFECEVPIISAVGHETDTTIIDYVSDLRAPTPSAAAELAVYDLALVERQMKECRLRLLRIMLQKIQMQRMYLERQRAKLSAMSPESKIREYHLQLDELQDALSRLMKMKLDEAHLQQKELESSLQRAMKDEIKEERHKLAVYIEKMKGLSPLDKLNQGFSYVMDEESRCVRSVKQIEKDDKISVYVTDGVINANVIDVVRRDSKWQ